MLKIEGGFNVEEIKRFFVKVYFPIKIGIYVLATLNFIVYIASNNLESFVMSIALIVGAEMLDRALNDY